MNKKLLVLFLISILAIFFFTYNKHFKYILPKEYKKEIETILKQELPKATQEIDRLNEKIKNEKDPFDKDTLIETGINTVLFNLYNKIIFATQKYKNISKEIPATDFNVDLVIMIYPYLKKNQINYTALKQFLNYTDKKQIEFEQQKTSH